MMIALIADSLANLFNTRAYLPLATKIGQNQFTNKTNL